MGGIVDRLGMFAADSICKRTIEALHNVPDERKQMIPDADKLRSMRYVVFLQVFDTYLDPKTLDEKKEALVLGMKVIMDQERAFGSPYVPKMDEIYGSLQAGLVKSILGS